MTKLVLLIMLLLDVSKIMVLKMILVKILLVLMIITPEVHSKDKKEAALFEPSSAITTFSAGGQYVMLTFDSGPRGMLTNRILDILRDKNASATFFVQGSRAFDHPHILKRFNLFLLSSLHLI